MDPTTQQLQTQVTQLNDMLQLAVGDRNKEANEKLQTGAQLLAERRKVEELTKKVEALTKQVAELEADKPKANGDGATPLKKPDGKRAESRPN